MKLKSLIRKSGLAAFVAVGAIVLPFQASPDDIDIFSVDENNTVNKPNVLIVLDNTSNWSRQSQQWPGGEQQGQSEVAAISQVVGELDESVNVGLMEFVTGGSANDNGGFVRFDIKPMSDANKAALQAELKTIYDNINAPIEKRNSNTAYGNLIYDVHNYFAGVDVSNDGTGTPSTADGEAYSNFHTRFRSPLTADDACARTIMILIGNADSSGPEGDDAANVAALDELGGDTSQIKFANYTTSFTPVTVNAGYDTACRSSAAACTTAIQAFCTEQGFRSCTCDDNDKLPCPLTSFTITGTDTQSVTNVISDDTTTQANQATGGAVICQKNSPGALACPGTSTNTTTSGNQTTTETISWSACSYVDAGSCGGSRRSWTPQGTKTTRTVVRETDSETTTTDVGSSACVESTSDCNPATFPASCSSFSEGCACTGSGTTSGCGAGTRAKFQIDATLDATTVTATGTFSVPPTKAGLNFMSDEWVRFLRQVGVNRGSYHAKVTTYTIDVFNAQQNAVQTGLLFNMARVGGGKYFAARNKNSLVDALQQIFSEVQAVNSAFSSASLPVNATNRAQNENQVFIGVFRPDRAKLPLWFGNLKRYKLVQNGSTVELGDSDGRTAINNQTGFISECAKSFWTTDTPNYWSDVLSALDPVPEGTCQTNSTDDFSDEPDGPFVEKGAVAEVLRKGNIPGATADVTGPFTRTVLTRSGSSLTSFTTAQFADPGLLDPATEPRVVNFIRGMDDSGKWPDEDQDGSIQDPRASIHGDVVHSRPQPVSYGGDAGVVVFYGANDGTYRAVRAANGQELWAFVAPEHYTKMERLWRNEPAIKYFGDNSLATEPKDYFFDGSTGVLQTLNNGVVNIYPTMRRGGRMVYGFDVRDPASPGLLSGFPVGCPNLTNDSGCTAGFGDIGQTWSLPSAARVRGYGAGETPVVMFGGGYDACEDTNSAAPACGAAKGRGVYIVDASTGGLLQHFDFAALFGGTARSVAADLALIDIDQDSMVDYAYAVDLGGNVYRINFLDANKAPLGAGSWTAQRIAFTNGGGRKFLFPPALFQATASLVYLAIGTGDREHPLLSQYPFEDVLNRFYVFQDDLGTDPALDLDSTPAMSDYSGDVDCDTPKILPDSTPRGWFMDLNDQGPGEQVVTSAIITAGFAIFSTNRPTPPEGSACSTSLGEARGYFVNLFNASGGIGVDGACGGAQSAEFVGGGLPPSPVVATVPVGQNGDGHDEYKTVVIGAVQRDGSASSVVGAQRVIPPINAIRRPVYWFKLLDAE